MVSNQNPNISFPKLNCSSSNNDDDDNNKSLRTATPLNLYLGEGGGDTR